MAAQAYCLHIACTFYHTNLGVNLRALGVIDVCAELASEHVAATSSVTEPVVY